MDIYKGKTIMAKITSRPIHITLKTVGAFYVLTSLSALANASPVDSKLTITPELSKTQVVFNWKTDRCSDDNIPDSPARAFKSADGTVNLYATHYINRSMTGNSLDSVKQSCEIRFEAKMDSRPQLYDARVWLQTFYSEDNGNKVISLASSDYHGRWFKNCDESQGKNLGCWWSAIILAQSDDGGKSFNTESPSNRIIAQSNYKFSNRESGPIGFLTTSNIVKIDEWYYSIFYTSKYKDQNAGNCLARTSDINSKYSWRFWDGRDFSIDLSNPYASHTKSKTCVTLKNLSSKIRSLTWHSKTKEFIASHEDFINKKPPQSRVDARFSFSTSKDLIHWSNPKEIITITGKKNCQPQSPAAYPSILDSNSTDRNFGTVGNNAYLYYTKFNLGEDCRLTLDRDLLRVPINLDVSDR
ncbi:hypothetical protein [Pseudomonas alabamensis]|uniref:hypothetical protein n=1 Tax=Pseudomonas alabamensis TaxID=3064349 RepID=UPI0012D8E713